MDNVLALDDETDLGRAVVGIVDKGRVFVIAEMFQEAVDGRAVAAEEDGQPFLAQMAAGSQV